MTKQKTTEQFIIDAKQKHGDKYDYSKVVYENNLKEVKIICKDHGEFLQLPKTHKRGNGCKDCGRKKTINGKKSNTNDFIEKAIKIHGDKYDYSKVDYIKNRTKIIIICQKHGEFLQKPNNHLNGTSCYKCGRDACGEKLKKTQEQFIQEAILKQGDKYDYSKVDYTNIDTKVIIVCKNHGEFLQTPYSHLQGIRCMKCSHRYSPTTDEFIEKAIKIHGNRYDYSKVEYKNTNTKITIICKKHGEFLQTPSDHITSKAGCPRCRAKTEDNLYEKMLHLYPTLTRQFKQEWCKKINRLPFDFCIPEYKIIIELDGPQHFQQIMGRSSPEEQIKNDKYKQKCANDNGYSVIRLTQEDVFYDTYDCIKYLCDTIEEIKNGNEVANVYLCKNNEYNTF